MKYRYRQEMFRMEFKLEKWQANYIDDFMAATDDPNLSDNLCETMPYPMDVAYAHEYIRERMFNSEERQICRAIIVDGHAVGNVEVMFGEGIYSKTGELSIWLAKPYRLKGLGTEVIRTISARVFDEYDILRIESHPYVSHLIASAALKKAGFFLEGTIHSAIFKDGKSYDYDVYARIKGKEQ